MTRSLAAIPLICVALAACGDDAADGLAPTDTGQADTTILQPDTAGDTAAPDTGAPPDTTGPADTAAPTDTAAPCPGCPGSPCDGPEDCDSGFCLDGPAGLECAKTCIESCPAGYSCKGIANPQGDPTFVCVYDHITYCRPCRIDDDCELGVGGVSGARCVEGAAAGQGRFCRTACTPGSCPDGAECVEVDVDGDLELLCRPVGGAPCACSARAIAAAASTDCAIANGFGACAGERVCEAAGLSACDAAIPVAEACNDADDDCDGDTDEDFAAKGEACDGDDSDECAEGTWICDADGALRCTDDPTSKVEICNDADDDCDGDTDEDFANKGAACDGAADVDACDDGTWVCDGLTLVCDDDAAGPIEVCNGEDDDCDGDTDEGFAGLGDPCDNPDDTDLCQDGMVVCSADGQGVECDDDSTSLVELCNGQDDTCNVTVDEGFEAKGQPCDGDDDDACTDGQLVCNVEQTGLVCNDDAASKVELCNNIDDDCQNGVDDAFPDKLKPCDGADDDECADGVYVCGPNQTELVCTDDAVSKVELCNNVDDDCDSETDEDFPLKGTACDSPVDDDLCKDGVYVCQNNGLVCGDDDASVVETCSGADDDCDGKTDLADEDLVAPLNSDQSGACAGTRQACSGVGGFVDDYSGVATYGQAETPDALFFDENCDGLDGDVARAVFVAPNASNNASCSLASPCGSLNHALTKVSAARPHVYVRAGTYDEVVVIAKDVEIYGGFDSSWKRDARTQPGHKVTIRGAKYAPDGQYETIRVRGVTGSNVTVTIADLFLEGASPAQTERDASGRGLSSYVVHAKSADVTLERVEVLQGDGADGAGGSPGSDAPSLTAPSKATRGGASAQAIEIRDASTRGTGASGRTNSQCSSGTAGGRGGDGGTMDTSCYTCVECLGFDLGCFTADVCGQSIDLTICTVNLGVCPATSGATGASGSGASAGGGGSGGSGGSSCSGSGAGNPGGTPSHGQGGDAGPRDGLLSGDFWVGGSGGVGAVGSHGSGGGGGGGSGGCDNDGGVPLQNSSGAGGGGGGAGGCRAQSAGTGGQGGGSSFGVFGISSTIVARDCRFELGNGGDGGDGGDGGQGQPGGLGGDGGNAAGSSQAGGGGGRGGDGGASGGGGGGPGGSAIGVLVRGGSASLPDSEVNGGSAGQGGDGGDAPSAAGSAGDGDDALNGRVEASRACGSSAGC